MKIKIIDKTSPHYGRSFEGRLVTRNALCGRMINGKIQNKYSLNVDGVNLYYYSYQIDEDKYNSDMADAFSSKIGIKVGDKVEIVSMGSGSVFGYWKAAGAHVVSDISSDGCVYLDEGKACLSNPVLKKIE